jgi:hypothetical protein
MATNNPTAKHCLPPCLAMKTLHANASILNIQDAAEEEFVRLNLLYTGFMGETYT